ncbi:MAG: DUF2779 domain-containing protein [Treponema sp.]|jgi:hypothetical protein|nr:DUF2779 domain-containing protein [Treponema sp.]
MNLSKTRYCKGIQCPKILWLDEHKPEVRDDSVMNQRVLETGSRVGDLAMGYYGEYTEIPYSEDKSLMIAETQKLLNTKAETICEASFSYDGNFCSVDILRVIGSDIELTEVKSSTEIKPIYYDDVAYQYYVLTSCGLNVSKVSVMCINNKYERQGNLDLNGLFIVHDCTEEVRSMQKEIIANIGRFRESVMEENEPDTDIGEQCFDPYECVYCAYCWQHIPKHSVFDISGHHLRSDKKFALYRRGIVSFEQLLDSDEKLNATARLQVETQVYNRPPAVDKEAIRVFLEDLSWPLYFLDFESFQEAVPPFDGLRPHMQTPFQYSLHIQNTPGADPEHREFLAEEGKDPRRAIAERLCADIPQNVCVLAYCKGYEKGRIKEIAAWLDNNREERFSTHLMNIHDNIKDLMQPFQSRAYYSRELGGSYSIKRVLPALCPNESELDYNALDLIHYGGETMTAYAELSGKSPEERQRIRSALLAYCRLDTLAMVKILEKLREMCG